MTEFRTPFQAGSHIVYSAGIKSGGVDVLLAQISSILLTIVDDNENIINGVENVEIKNQNGGVVTDGQLELTLDDDDTAEDPADPSGVQVRYLHIDITLVGGAKRIHEVLWYIDANHVPGDD